MGGDYTRFTFKPEKNYSGVRKQQGRVSLDSDWNELSEIEDRRRRSETMDVLGRCAVPATTPDAFRVVPTGPGTFEIGPGRAYVDGLQAECHGGGPAEYDPVLGEERGTSPVPYGDQPYYPAPLPPPLATTPPAAIAGRTDLIYLDVWQREVTVIEDPGLREIALGGPDTTTRVQTAWQVKAIQNVGDISCPDPVAGWDAATRPSAGRLTTSTYMPPPEDNPCIITAAGGYRGLENRLYRVEIHTAGGPGAAKFKWSRNNASIVSAVTAVSSSGAGITVDRVGRDDVLRFNVGDWVEITDDRREYQGLPGYTARIDDINEADRIITLHAPVPASYGFDATDASRHTRLRRWDQTSGVDAQGLLTVPASAATKVDLEDGIQVSFALDPAVAGGEFKSGDYWVFCARTADGSVESLAGAPPRGLKHHYCRLALVTWGATAAGTLVRDCRTLWPPADCCTIAVRPGEDIQVAVDQVPAEGGCVCLLPGVHRLHRPLVIDGRTSLLLTGAGAASVVVYEPPAGADSAPALLWVTGKSREIEVANLLLYADALEHLVFVDGASETVAVENAALINARIQENTQTDCVLLGECCDVKVERCRLVGMLDVVQADSETLARVRATPSGAGSAGGPAPAAARNRLLDVQPPAAQKAPLLPVPTLHELFVRDNGLFFTAAGVHLQDAVRGAVEKNRFQAVAPEVLQTFTRPAPQKEPVSAPGIAAERLRPVVAGRPAMSAAAPGASGTAAEAAAPAQTDFYSTLDDRLQTLSSCPHGDAVSEEEGETSEAPAAEPPVPAGTIGLYACVLEGFGIARNEILAADGVALEFSREVKTEGNAITAGRVGLYLGFGFQECIEGNRVRIVTPDDGATEAQTPPAGLEGLWTRYSPGLFGIGLGFARGVKIRQNAIRSHSAVGGWRTLWKRCSNVRPLSYLRVLGIERPWHVVVELTWFLYQLFQLASAAGSGAASGGTASGGSTSGGTASGAALTPKEEFERSLFQSFGGILNHPLFPVFVSKADVSENRMSVTRFGIFFNEILTISGLRVRGNRISGFQKAGILVRPWYGAGFADQFAGWLRCLLTWFIMVLVMLRDGLKGLLKGQQPAGQFTGASGILGTVTQGVSWVLALCSRYCTGSETPPGGTGTPAPPTPAQVLVDTLDDFLNRLDLGWLDDLVNQPYEIDGNALAGSGDGIWTGIDGSRIEGNRVRIWPGSPVPSEAMIFGLLIRQQFGAAGTAYFTSEIQFLADSAVESDRDLVLFGALQSAGWVGSFIKEAAFRTQLHTLLGAWSGQIDPASPLAAPVADMEQGLSATPPDTNKVQDAWGRLLLVLATDLWGYGIAMRGANMVCRDNHVESLVGCRSPLPAQRPILSTGNFAVASGVGMQAERGPALVSIPALGGIWHFGNLSGLYLELLEILLAKKDAEDRVYRLVVWILFFLILSLQKERSLAVAANEVSSPLVYGVRALAVSGLDEIHIEDNTVREAARHGISFQPGLFGLFAGAASAQVHRNTVIRNHELATVAEFKGGDTGFASLIRVENQKGTTLMSENHGRDATLGGQDSAVYAGTAVAGITTNHVITAANVALEILASAGLFTDNMTNKPNNVSPATLAQGPNVQTL